MSVLHIIGVGSPWGLDRVGLLAVEALQASDIDIHCAPVALDFLALDRPGSRLLDIMAPLENVLLLDALQGGQPLASLIHVQPHQLAALTSPFSSHGIGVIETLKLGMALDSLPSRWSLYGIEVGELDAQARGAVPVDALVEEIMPKIYATVQAYARHIFANSSLQQTG